MALGATVKTGSRATSRAAARAAQAAARAARNPLIATLAQLSPGEMADPAIQARLARMGIAPTAQGFSGYVNGGPVAAGFVPSGGQLAIPATTGGPYMGPASVASTGGAAQSAARAAQATVPSRYVLTEADLLANAPQAAAQPMGRIATMLSTNPYAARAAAQTGLTGAELAAASRSGGRFAPGSLGRAGAYGIGGYVAANLLHSVVGERDGTWDDAGEGALKGAGIGAGIGSMILPGPGTLIGGALGGIGGGIWGKMTGNDSPGTERDEYLEQQLGSATKVGELTTLLSKYGLSPDTQQQVRLQIEALIPSLTSKNDAKALMSQVMSNLPALMEQDRVDRASEARIAAMQAYLLPMMRDSQAQTDQFMQQQYTLMNDSASRMSPSVATIYRQHGLDTLASNSRASQAMYQQMLLAPQLAQQQSQYGLPNPAADYGMYSPTG